MHFSQPRILTTMNTVNNTLRRSSNSMSFFSLWYFLDVSPMLCKSVFTSSWIIFLNPFTNVPIITIVMLSLINVGLFVKMLTHRLTTSEYVNVMINMNSPTPLQKLDILLEGCEQKSRFNFMQRSRLRFHRPCDTDCSCSKRLTIRSVPATLICFLCVRIPVSGQLCCLRSPILRVMLGLLR